jgi:hypothetical protein
MGHQLIRHVRWIDDEAPSATEGNHPVKELSTGHVLITSQNHGFAVLGSEQEIRGAGPGGDARISTTGRSRGFGTEAADLRRAVPSGGRSGRTLLRPLFKQANAVRDNVSRSDPNA